MSSVRSHLMLILSVLILQGRETARSQERTTAQIKALIKTIQEEGAPDRIKYQAVRDLGKIARRSTEAIQQLISLFDHRASRVQTLAFEAVVACRSSAVPPLIKSLESPSIPIVVDSCGALEVIGDKAPTIVAAVVKLLKHPSWEVQIAGIAWLRKFQLPETIPFLLQALKGETFVDVAIQLTRALEEQARTGHTKANAAIPSVVKWLCTKTEFDIRGAPGGLYLIQSRFADSLLGWGKVGQDALIQLLQNPNIQANTLDTVLREIRQHVLQWRDETDKTSVQSMKRFQKHLPLYMKLIRHKTPFVREIAIRLIGAFQATARKYVRQLEARLAQAPEREQAMLAETLNEIEEYNDPGFRALTRLLSSSDRNVRSYTIEVLRYMGKRAAKSAPFLIKLTYDKSEEIRVRALRALRSVAPGNKAFQQRAREMLNDPGAGVRDHARRIVSNFDEPPKERWKPNCFGR